MGIAFSHGSAQWSYSGFNTFRKRICKTIGLISSLDEEIYEQGLYKFLINDPIYPFIDHSDCEGELTIEEMEQIIPRLEEVLNKWQYDGDPFLEHDIVNGEQLIVGMKQAIKKGEPLGFH